jgi:FAD/FMN-containing dehydrogenase
MRPVDRRGFLKLTGRFGIASLGLTALPTACTWRTGNVPNTVPTTRPTSTSSAVGPSPSGDPVPATDADWRALRDSLKGTLVRPGQSGYSSATQLFDPRFDGSHPQGVVYAASPSDVQRSVAFIRAHGLAITARSGGGSYAGYSTGPGLVCDVTRMAAVSLSGQTATIGAGAHLIDVYSAIAPRGMLIAAGSCPTVGVAGLLLGGGQGVIGRKFGVASDNVRSVRIVTAAGDLLTCDERRNADLYWACRGGGGGNFGIVTSFDVAAHPIGQLSHFYYAWPWPAAADVLSAWQDWGNTAPDELWSTCHLLATAGMQPQVTVAGVYVGGASALSAQLQALIAAVGSGPSTEQVRSDPLLETMLIEAGCSGSTAAGCHLPTQDPQGRLERSSFFARSAYFSRPLSDGAIGTLIDHIAAAATGDGTGGAVAFDAWGAALNRPSPSDTAFVHRTSRFLAQYSSTWPSGAPASKIRANRAWLTALHAAMQPHANGEAYQNYIDPDLQDWPRAYYGANLPRLRRIKTTYDPDRVFRFAQSIPPLA